MNFTKLIKFSTFGKLDGVSPKTNLIGDLSVQHALPVVPGPRDKYTYISVDTMATLLREHSNSYKRDKLRRKSNNKIDRIIIIDARYGYEFNGGHIRGADNIPSQVTCDS